MFFYQPLMFLTILSTAARFVFSIRCNMGSLFKIKRGSIIYDINWNNATLSTLTAGKGVPMFTEQEIWCKLGIRHDHYIKSSTQLFEGLSILFYQLRALFPQFPLYLRHFIFQKFLTQKFNSSGLYPKLVVQNFVFWNFRY